MLALIVTLAATTPNPIELSLDEALRELEQASLDLAQARGRAEEARAISRQALAQLLPALTATGSYVRNSEEARIDVGEIISGLPRVPSVAETPETIIQPEQQWTGGAALRVPLIVPNAWYERLAAEAGAEAAAALLEASRLHVRTAFTQAAWGAAALEETVSAAERALLISRQHADSAARALAAGTAEPLARLRADTEVVRKESELARARAEMERARLALGILLGRAAPVRVILPPAAPPATLDSAALTDRALAARPELAAEQAQVAATEHQRSSAYWRLAPQLSATGSVFVSNVPYPTGEKEGWRATVDLTWALYDGGLRYGRAQQVEAQLGAARAGAAWKRLDVVREVEDAVRDVEVTQHRLRLAEQQSRLAREAAGSADRAFSAGVASSLDVLDANDRLYQADVALADARARLGIALAALTLAAGGAP